MSTTPENSDSAHSIPLRLSPIHGHGMVLQQGQTLIIRGHSLPGAAVSLHVAGAESSTRADAEGRFECPLPPLEAGGPHVLRINSAGHSLEIGDVLIGEVWLCSGQSNMVLPLSRIREQFAAAVEATAGLPIRCFRVPDRVAFGHEETELAGGSWMTMEESTMANISALPWFYAAELARARGVPVGVVVAAVGGSPVHAFLSRRVLADFPEALAELAPCLEPGHVEKVTGADDCRQQEWSAELDRRDAGLAGAGWQAPDAPDSDWQQAAMPASWMDSGLGNEPGVVWYRKEIWLPPQAAGGPASVRLGTLIDADQVWVNGVPIGSTGYRYPPRRYPVPAGVTRPGRNLVAIRLIGNGNEGGVTLGKRWEFRLEGAQPLSLDLAGFWRCRRGAVMPPLAERTFFTRKPSSLYGGMIHPVLRYGYRGALWYQGESDSDQPAGYRQRLEAMIADWRRLMGTELPFILVQLVNFGPPADSCGQSSWAEIRQAQWEASGLPGTALAVTIDLGEWNDLHPENKRDVAARLALLARRQVYGEAIVAGGPRLVGWRRESSGIRLDFTGTDGGLVARDAQPDGSPDGSGPRHFALAGSDGLFKPAQAAIEGDSLLVWCDGLARPARLRYAWADNPAGCNLWNGAGWPASPFSLELTDSRS